MKKALLLGVLLASQFSNAQRILEKTNGSWNHPDHSIETYSDWLIHGCTDLNPVTGRITPMFKRTVFNNIPLNSFWLDFNDDVYLMDFTIKPSVGSNPSTIIMAGMTASNTPGIPYNLVVAEADMAGTILQSSTYAVSNNETMIPHKVIYSQGMGQIVIVGTKSVDIYPPGTNPTPSSKKGFMLGIDIAGLGIMFSSETDTPSPASSDYDMLESVCEVPGMGYFATGSANTNNEQNLFVTGFNYGGGTMYADIYDNTNNRWVGASATYHISNSGQPEVLVMANNDTYSMFEIGGFDPMTGMLVTPFYHYPINNLPVGQGIDVNGFRLEFDGQNQVLVGGYITSVPGILTEPLTPFLMVISPNLTTFLSGKTYQSGNYSPLTSYFDESGASVFINTPDMFTFVPKTKTTHVISPNTVDQGYDVDKSSPYQASQCERKFPASVFITPVPLVGQVNPMPLQITPVSYPGSTTGRTINESVLCAFANITTPSTPSTFVSSTHSVLLTRQRTS